jgi:hypothetical protein
VAKINEVVYSIGWAHEVSGFENPCKHVNWTRRSVRFRYNNITAFSVFICLTFFYEDGNIKIKKLNIAASDANNFRKP